ncbi:MAG: hypothetical protein RL141_1145 [Candidatus Parcubacteria bacterium]
MQNEWFQFFVMLGKEQAENNRIKVDKFILTNRLILVISIGDYLHRLWHAEPHSIQITNVVGDVLDSRSTIYQWKKIVVRYHDLALQNPRGTLINLSIRFFFVVVFGILGCRSGKEQEALIAERRTQMIEADITILANRVATMEQRLGDPMATDALRVTRVPLVENSTGNEVCAGEDKVCLSVLFRNGARLVDPMDRPCGYAVADCNSRVVSLPRCGKGADYVVAPIKFWSSPGMKGGCSQSGNQSCLFAPENLVALCIDKQ